VLNGSSHDFVTLDVALTIDGSNVTLTGLVPVAKPTDAAGWAAFDPATEFIADPNTKHAYVYAGDGDDVLRDAAAQLNPDSPADKFVLSHICPSPVTTTTTEEETTTTEEETTTTTEEETTTTTEEGTTTTEGETTTTAQVLGNVVTPPAGVAAAQLPRTGDNDQALALIGAGLLLIGGGAMLVRRDLLGHS
jgi:LPXTG-motif cell wall-anchored protein